MTGKLCLRRSAFVIQVIFYRRNATYVRIGSPFPSEEEFAVKHELVSRAANELYNTWVRVWKQCSPYLHAILHNEAYLHYDVVDRSAEALEHLNKIVKAITKRGLKRHQSKEKREQQIAKADAAGKDHRGILREGSGTFKHALKMSLARAHFDRKFPQRKDWWARKHHQQGRISKALAALSLEDYVSKTDNSNTSGD